VNSQRCPSCGLVNFAGVTACRRCGTDLTAPPIGQAPPAPFPPPAPGPQPSAPGAQRPYVPGPYTPSPYGAPYAPPKRKSSNAAAVAGVAAGVVIALIVGVAVRYAFLHGSVDWQPFQSPDNSFEIQMPGSVEKQVQTTETGGLTSISVYMFGSEVRGQGAAMIGYADYPIDADTAVDNDKLFDGAVNGAMSQSKSTLISSHRLTVQGHEAVAFEASPPKDQFSDGVTYGQAVWVRPRIYFMLVAGERSSQLVVERERFLGSFKLRK
jgi:hypothetical protein